MAVCWQYSGRCWLSNEGVLHMSIGGRRMFEHYKILHESLKYISLNSGLKTDTDFSTRFWCDLLHITAYDRTFYLIGPCNSSEHYNLKDSHLPKIFSQLQKNDDYWQFHRHHELMFKGSDEHPILFDARQSKIMGAFYVCLFYKANCVQIQNINSNLFDDEYYLSVAEQYRNAFSSWAGATHYKSTIFDEITKDSDFSTFIKMANKYWDKTNTHFIRDSGDVVRVDFKANKNRGDINE